MSAEKKYQFAAVTGVATGPHGWIIQDAPRAAGDHTDDA
jgi:hypothetical protein